MKLFVFKIHEDCSYVAGMAVIVAKSAADARNYLLALKNRYVWPAVGDNGKFIDKNDVVSVNVRPEGKVTPCRNEWYLAKTYDLSDGYDSITGVRCVSYHDG